MIEPGQTCPACERRVPHPRRASSPKTAVVSYRAPLDEVEAHRETLEITARYLGTFERPHWQFWTSVYALAAVLQDEDLRGAAGRNPDFAESADTPLVVE